MHLDLPARPPASDTVIRAAAVAAVLGLSLLLAAPSASAHSFVVSADPADGSSVATGPATVSLTFNEPIQEGFDTLTLVGPDGNLWSTGPTTIDGAKVSVGVRPLGPAGKYTIGYRVISADSHPVSGSRSFTPSPPPAPGPRGPPADAAASSGTGSSGSSGGVPAWVFVVAAVVVFGGGLGLTLRGGARQQV